MDHLNTIVPHINRIYNAYCDIGAALRQRDETGLKQWDVRHMGYPHSVLFESVAPEAQGVGDHGD